MIKRIVKLTFRKEEIDNFMIIFEQSKKGIRAFEGCHHMELLRGLEPDNVLFTFSIWESEAALNNYRNSQLFQNTWTKTKALFADRPQAWSVSLIDEG